MFGKKKTPATEQFDKEKYRAVLRCSICTGEQVAGFKDIHTEEFHDVMLIKGEADLAEFKSIYGVEDITKEY